MSKRCIKLSAEAWLQADFSTPQDQIIVGTPTNAIIRPFTKNFVIAPDKSFKTTFSLQFTAGLSCGHTCFEQLPVLRPMKTLYFHGELSPPEIKERIQAGVRDLDLIPGNLIHIRDIDANLLSTPGREAIIREIKAESPHLIVLDPWADFISGFDESDSVAMSNAQTFIDRLITDFNLTFLIMAHFGKDRARGIRGHSSIGGWMDTRMELCRQGMTNNATLSVFPRWGAPLEEMALIFNEGRMNVVTSGWTAQEVAMRSYLVENGGQVSREQMAAHLRLAIDSATFRSAVKRAKDRGAIVVNSEKFILLPSVANNPFSPPLIEGEENATGESKNALHDENLAKSAKVQ